MALGEGREVQGQATRNRGKSSQGWPETDSMARITTVPAPMILKRLQNLQQLRPNCFNQQKWGYQYPFKCMYICIHIHTYIHTYIQTDIHTYIHIYMYIYLQVFILCIYKFAKLISPIPTRKCGYGHGKFSPGRRRLGFFPKGAEPRGTGSANANAATLGRQEMDVGYMSQTQIS